MKVELIKPHCIHLRTIPSPIGTVFDCDDWKGQELIDLGVAIPQGKTQKKSKTKSTPIPEREADNPELQ